VAEHGYPERTVAFPRAPVTVGLGGEDPAELRACGVDPATRGRRMDEALAVLSVAMEGFYQLPFGKFEKHSPCGTPAHIAESLRPYAEAGCRSFNLIPVADSEQAAIEGAAEVRALLGEKVR
jgi:hypothetical protein